MKSQRLQVVLLIFWLILAGLIVWFKIVPNGRATYYLSYPTEFKLLGGKGFIGNLTPADRVEINSGELAKITGDPVYFSVFTPRTFSEAKITFTYQENLTTSTPIIEAGVLVDNIVWRYQLAPLENKILDTNFNSWEKLQSGDILLLQKNKRFLTIADFLLTLKNQPKTICGDNLKSCLALYNTESLTDYLASDYQTTKEYSFSPINVPLKGAHQFYFTVNNIKDLEFSFDLVDLNLDKKADPIIVSIYKNSDKIYSTTIEDNFGNEGTAQVRNSAQSISYTSTSSFSGLYKLEIKAGEDVVIKKISKAPSVLNLIGKIHPVNLANLPVSFWTDSNYIKLTTTNPASRQIINFGNQKFSLAEPYQQFEFTNLDLGLKKITLSKDDIILETGGVFSLAASDFFNPEFNKVNEHFALSDGLSYILAQYKSPTSVVGGLKQSSVILNTKEAYREQGKYSFMISVPGLSLAKEGNLLIKDIKVEFSGRTLFDKIKEKIAAYVN